MVSLIFKAEAEKVCRETLNESDILCYLVITQAVTHPSDLGKAETSYFNLHW